ncbi:hypothetical protein KL951_004266 [Ogataea haglerorum]|nr:hypothetical protein KL951_004266 [Ogataea haglerorum]
MTGEQFNLALTCLFFTYGLFEPVSNIALKRGWRAWRWLFLIEGVATVFVALLGYVLLPNFPGESKIRFFSDKELDYLYLRKKYDNGPAGSNQKFEMKQAWNALKDPQVYFVMLMF